MTVKAFVMFALLMVLVVVLSVGAPPLLAHAQNYVPTDPSTLPQVPGCSWYDRPGYPGLYEIWCGSDELGWYQPYEWYLLTGIYPPDYGLTGG